MGARAWVAAVGSMLAASGCLSKNPSWNTEPQEGGPLALYRFDEGSGSIAHDASGYQPALDLDVSTSFTWTESGLMSSGISAAVSTLPAGRIAAAVALSNEVTIELWVTPSTEMTEDSGPHRMVSNSINSSERNFTLGVIGGSTAGWVARLRTSGTSNNGTPEITVSTERPPVMTHFVLTHDANGGDALYLQGGLAAMRQVGDPLGSQKRADDRGLSARPDVFAATGSTGDGTGGPTGSGTDTGTGGSTTSDSSSDSGSTGEAILESGSLDVWNAGYPILIGNELQDARGFIGEFHYVAIYDRAMSADEVAARATTGVPSK